MASYKFSSVFGVIISNDSKNTEILLDIGTFHSPNEIAWSQKYFNFIGYWQV